MNIGETWLALALRGAADPVARVREVTGASALKARRWIAGLEEPPLSVGLHLADALGVSAGALPRHAPRGCPGWGRNPHGGWSLHGRGWSADLEEEAPGRWRLAVYDLRERQPVQGARRLDGVEAEALRAGRGGDGRAWLRGWLRAQGFAEEVVW